MQKHELPELAKRLTQLAEALQGRAPGASGLVVWLDALEECPFADVQSVLTDWPKSNARMPVPADVLKLCRERMSRRIEQQSTTNAQRARDPWDLDNVQGDPNSSNYLAFKAWWAEFKRRGVTRAFPEE